MLPNELTFISGGRFPEVEMLMLIPPFLTSVFFVCFFVELSSSFICWFKPFNKEFNRVLIRTGIFTSSKESFSPNRPQSSLSEEVLRELLQKGQKLNSPLIFSPQWPHFFLL